MRNYWEDIKEFYEYVWKFYNLKTGLYPIATDERIQEAVNQYLESKPLGEIYFDTFDREQVRGIIGK
jgi:hypothetical protein